MHATVAVIGAGPSGLTAAKNCLEAGLAVEVFEKNNQVGGNWVFNSRTGHSSVYENTHIISSKAWSEYEDFPMPAEYPDYPNHRQLQAYFEKYAKHFGVYETIRFQTTVEHVERQPDGQFLVTWSDNQGKERSKIFSHLMVANGHHWNPKHPELPDEFTGRYLHSHDFKGVDDTWRGKRVLVIGAGNSACDVAVESARIAETVHLSMRSPQWFLPKFMFGKPSDVLGSRIPLWVPNRIRQWVLTRLVKLMQGSYKAEYNLPEPQSLLLSHHPTVNSDLLDFIRHGRIHPRADITSVNDQMVGFSDGKNGIYDILVACTGFRISFPFFAKSFIDFENSEKVPLYLKMMHEKYENLYFIGLFQPLGCIWPLADYQAKIAVQEIIGRYKRPKNMQAAIQHEIEHPHLPFESGSRHSTQVDYHKFRRDLKAALKGAGIDIGNAPEGKAGAYKSFLRVQNTKKAG